MFYIEYHNPWYLIELAPFILLGVFGVGISVFIAFIVFCDTHFEFGIAVVVSTRIITHVRVHTYPGNSWKVIEFKT